jgi:hypothetical protein
MAIPKLDSASNTTGGHELAVRLSDTAAATAPTGNETLPSTARTVRYR